MKILIDMNLSPRWQSILQAAGYDAVHWSAVGPGSATDAEIMDYARAQDFVVMTQDLDFGEILSATQGTKPSVVIVRSESLRPETIQKQVLIALRTAQLELEYGALVSISPSNTRLRILPLH